MVVVNHFPNQLNQTEKMVNPNHVVGGTHSHLFMPTIQTHPKLGYCEESPAHPEFLTKWYQGRQSKFLQEKRRHHGLVALLYPNQTHKVSAYLAQMHAH
jgi:hypothetical protein